MKPKRFDARHFFRLPEAVACVVDPSDVFGMLNRSLALPSDWAALLTHSTGDRVVCPPGSELSDDDTTDIMLFRTSPITLSYTGLTATSADGYQCAAVADLRVSLIPERSELGSFRNAVLGSLRTADTDVLAKYFDPHLRTALACCAEGRGVEVLIDAKSDDEFAREVADHLKGPAFSAGLKLTAPVSIRFDSPVYRQVRRARLDAARQREEFDARRRIKHAAEAAQQQHAKHLAELLEKLREQADQTPGLGLVDLLKTFSESERGELYQALCASTDPVQRTQSIVAAAGLELLFFNPEALSTPARRVPIPDTVGALRSVQIASTGDGGHRLLIGAACGVMEIAPDGDAPLATYHADPRRADAKVHGGFNSVAIAGDRILATHSELGLVSWPRTGGAVTEQTGKPVNLLLEYTKDARAVRSVQFFDGDLYLSIDHRVFKMRADDTRGDPTVLDGNASLITALCPDSDGVYAGNADGQILFWQKDDTDHPRIIHTGRQRPVEAVFQVDFGGAKRLFYTDTSTAVFARVLGDSFVCRYEAGGQTLRRVEVAPDLIVATNEVRDRLICWTPGEPAQPLGIVPVAQLTGHSVQDVCLIPAS